jgi:hypothetical protein
MHYEHPVHDKRRLRFRSPEQMKQIFLEFPLNKEFVDWVVKLGFKVAYAENWKPDSGAVWWSLNKIIVSSGGNRDLEDLVLMHELIHIGLSENISFTYMGLPGLEAYERAIDEIAKHHLKDKNLLDYIKIKLPTEHYTTIA